MKYNCVEIFIKEEKKVEIKGKGYIGIILCTAILRNSVHFINIKLSFSKYVKTYISSYEGYCMTKGNEPNIMYIWLSM